MTQPPGVTFGIPRPPTNQGSQISPRTNEVAFEGTRSGATCWNHWSKGGIQARAMPITEVAAAMIHNGSIWRAVADKAHAPPAALIELRTQRRGERSIATTLTPIATTRPIAIKEAPGVPQGDDPNNTRPAQSRPPRRMNAAETETVCGMSLLWRMGRVAGSHRYDSNVSGSGEVLWPGEATYCSDCGTCLERAFLYGRERGLCPGCGRIDFRSPSVAVAVVLRNEEGRILMVKRGPGSSRAGLWSIPAGYMDYGEEVRQAGAREILEETGLVVEVGDPIFVATNFHDPLKVSVCIWFSGTVVGGDPAPGSDAVDLGWFVLDDLPDLAFDTDATLIQQMRSRGGNGT